MTVSKDRDRLGSLEDKVNYFTNYLQTSGYCNNRVNRRIWSKYPYRMAYVSLLKFSISNRDYSYCSIYYSTAFATLPFLERERVGLVSSWGVLQYRARESSKEILLFSSAYYTLQCKLVKLVLVRSSVILKSHFSTRCFNCIEIKSFSSHCSISAEFVYCLLDRLLIRVR